jgi:hypothetical protein
MQREEATLISVERSNRIRHFSSNEVIVSEITSDMPKVISLILIAQFFSTRQDFQHAVNHGTTLIIPRITNHSSTPW